MHNGQVSGSVIASLLSCTWGFLFKSPGVRPQHSLTHRVNCQLQSSVHLPSRDEKLEEMPFPNLDGLEWKDVFA